MAADIRPVGPGKLSVFGQGISNVGTALMNHFLGIQQLQEENKLKLQQELAAGILQNPMMAPLAIQMMQRLGINLPGMTDQPAGGQGPGMPSGPSGLSDTSLGETAAGQMLLPQIMKAKSLQELPTPGALQSQMEFYAPGSSTPDLTGRSSGETNIPIPGQPGMTGPNFAPERPAIEALLAQRDAQRQNILQGIQDTSTAQALGKFNPQIGSLEGQYNSARDIAEAPGAQQLYGARGQGYEHGRNEANFSDAKLLQDFARMQSQGREQGTLDVQNNPANVKASAGREAAITGAGEQARQDVLFSLPNELNRLKFQAASLTQNAAIQRNSTLALQVQEQSNAASQGLAALADLQKTYSTAKIPTPTGLFSSVVEAPQIAGRKLDQWLGTQNPQAAAIDQKSALVKMYMWKALGLPGSPSKDDLDSLDTLVPNSTTLGASGQKAIQTASAALSTAPVVAQDTIGKSVTEKVQASQRAIQAYMNAVANGYSHYIGPNGEVVQLAGGGQ